MNKDFKTGLFVAILAGIICGVICLIGFLFLEPQSWYFSILIAGIMGVAVWFKSAYDKKKNAGKYERDEHLIDFPYIYSVEGYLRGDSDKDAKFYFGEDRIAALHYKNVRPIIEEFETERIKTGYMDRCGWFSILVKGEKRRLVIPKPEAEKAASVLEAILDSKAT